MTKKWSYADSDQITSHGLTGYPNITQRLLLSRGITSREEAEQFLNPDYERDLYDPFLMKDMDKAVSRITQAVKQEEKIMIFGDYDADGVPASALLAEFFGQIGFANFDVYIPHRHNEQYGLSKKAVNIFAKNKVDLIVTVDCGITAYEEVELANQKGIDVIITDHHLAPEVLPPAVAVVDPKRPDCNYPDEMLSGTGVAFKLVSALIKSGQFDWKPGQEKWLLDLVAIATVSDMVPLVRENRALTHYGLKVLRQTRRPGLLHLFNLMRLNYRYLTEDDIGFMVGPRLNSAGRMSHASQAYFLLTTNKEEEAGVIAKNLERQNKTRRKYVKDILAFIEGELQNRELQSVNVCGDPDWPIGVLGLVAARLVEKYGGVFFVWAKNGNGEIKGSCRSDGSVNVVELMRLADQNKLFKDVGGHAGAGGFSITEDKLPAMVEALNGAYHQLDRVEAAIEHAIEAELHIDEVTDDLFRVLDQFSPFGIGNPKPLFLFKNLVIEEFKKFGKEANHLEFKFRQTGGRLIKAIAFFASEDELIDGVLANHIFGNTKLSAGRQVDLLAHVEKSYFGFRPEVRLRVVDIR